MPEFTIETQVYADESKRLREERRRMKEIMGAMIFREVFPSRKFRSSELDGKKYHVRYKIKSVFPNKDSMKIAYSSPLDFIDSQDDNSEN